MQISERRILFLVGAVQFINVLDFMMVMPLGPDFASALDIPSSQLGLIGGAYTAAAAIAGLIGAQFLDRFDRRSALTVAMIGLVLGTAAGGFATGLPSLLAARVVAGCFGGPATSLSLSIIADVIPLERRGKALGAVMGAFAVASVLGVPAGLELARQGSWRLPFFAVAGLGVIIAATALFLMPPLRKHLEGPRVAVKGGQLAFLLRPPVLLALVASATVMMATFSLVPNLAAYLQFNAHYPREHMGMLYFVGGIGSFFAMRLIGPLVDRFGAWRVAAVGTVFLLADIALGFFGTPLLPVIVIFCGYMLSQGPRAVALNTLSSRVPAPQERARFMSTQSAVQHMASAIGAFMSSQLLTERPDKSLEGMPIVATLSMILVSTLPFLLWLVQRRLAAEKSATTTPSDGAVLKRAI